LPYYFEIYKSQDSLSSTCPMYVKFGYLHNTSNGPMLGVVAGTNSNGAGALSGNVTNGGTDVQSSTSPTNSGSVLYECDASYTTLGGSFQMIMWRGAESTNRNLTLIVERALDSTGNPTIDTFFNVAIGGANILFQSLYKAGAGLTMPAAGGSFVRWPTISNQNPTTAVNGLFAASPIFPLVGYVANPLLGAVVFGQNDVVAGSRINVVIYGTSHTYLVCKAGVNTVTGGGATSVGIRWE
jgi:hypothetical protein